VLTAVECWDEDVVLSTPPFPFVQRWDASQQIQRGKKKRKRGKSAAAPEYEEEYDHSQQPYYDGGVDLDYGDQSNNNEVSQPSTITTHLSQSSNGQNLPNTPLHHTTQSLPTPSPDLLDSEMIPFLPQDLTTLPALTLSAVRPGAIIVFKQLGMDHVTWQPTISPHLTATVVPGHPPPKRTDNIVHILLAKRDRVPIQYDEDGNRIVRRFGMPGTEAQEDAEARGEFALSYTEFIDARVLREAPLEDVQEEGVDEDEDEKLGDQASEGSAKSSEQDEVNHPTTLDTNAKGQEIIDDDDDKDDFYDEPDSSSFSAQQTHPESSQQSLPSSSQNFLDSRSSSSGLSPPPPDETVQVEDSQIKEEPIEYDVNITPDTHSNIQPIGDMITALSKAPLRKRAKTKRVIRRELKER